MKNSQKIFAKNPDYVSREVADEFILVPIRKNLNTSNSLYVLNQTGASFWRSLDGRQSIESIVQSLSSQFDVTLERLEKDLNALLEDLLSIEAVQEVVHDHG